ncbi:uncharacterized protein LOC123676837 isoform X4 [Harmonia axyridis]|uniref:uncharacterized protein LOC123676837 isoform X4 n=1 Tax=Harmonia axyridis TaxID=115357 RepID=UPI001E276E4D|nr:uncharacterized protein LOC123676837 isoform X4 [Harmonia axyridis]
MPRHKKEPLSYEYVLKYILWIKKISIFDFTLAKSYKTLWYFIMLWKLFLTSIQFYLFILILPAMDDMHLKTMEKYIYYAIHLLNLFVCCVLIFFNSDSYMKSGNAILSRYNLKGKDTIFLIMRRCIIIEYFIEEFILYWKIFGFIPNVQINVAIIAQTIFFMYGDIIVNLTATEFSCSLITLAIFALEFHENFRNTRELDNNSSYYIESCKEICSSGKKLFETFSNVIILLLFLYFLMVTYMILSLKLSLFEETKDGSVKYYWALLSILRVCKIIIGCSMFSLAINQMMDFLKSSITKMSDKDRKQVKFFLLERLHEPSILEIKKCLQFDGGLLYSAIGAITTYAVILFQLDELQTS